MSSAKRKTCSSGPSGQKRRMVEVPLNPGTEASEASPIGIPSGNTHSLLWLKEDVVQVLPTALVLSLKSSVVRF